MTYDRLHDAAIGAASVLSDVIGRFRRALAYSAQAAASGNVWGVGGGGSPLTQAEELIAGLKNVNAMLRTASEATEKGQDAAGQCRTILQVILTAN